MFTQLKPFIQANGGTTPNWCLANVIKGFGIAPRYPDAWTAWENTQQHSGDAPAGLAVPVFFSYTATIDGVNKNWGHIGVRLANGQFWSDGKVYNNISAYTSGHYPRYVGWGESVNGVQVIKGAPTVSKDAATLAEVDLAYISTLGRSVLNDAAGKQRVGQPIDKILTDLHNSAEWKARDAAAKRPAVAQPVETVLKPGVYKVN